MSKRFLTPPSLPSGSSLPAAGVAGDLFFKSDEAKIYVNDGIEWVVAQGGGGGGVVVSDTEPVDPEPGTYWFDSTTTKSYIYYDGFWVEVGEAGSGYIVSETPPTEASIGDVWFDTSQGILFIYYDDFWVDPTTGGAAGVPPAGTAGQVLAKVDGEDYNTEWVDLEAQNVGVDTTNFANLLSSTDTTVQAALETLDELSGGASVTVSETAPASPEEGDTWFNPTQDVAYVRSSGDWRDISNKLPDQTGNDGKLLITDGTDASWSSIVPRQFEIQSTTDPLVLQRYSNIVSGPYIYFEKTRAAISDTQAAVFDGDALGGLLFRGSDGNSFKNAAQLAVVVDGSPSISSVPASMQFRTTGKGGTSPTTRILLNSNGSSVFTKEQHIIEQGTVSSTSWSGTVNYSVKDTGSILRLTSDASGNWTLNIRFSSSETLDSIMSTGDILTVVAMVSNGATGYYQTGLQIDGTSVLPKWQDGVAPTTGTIDGTDVYTITILKLSTNTFEVFESVTKFA